MASWLRVAVVQFAPKLGEVHANIAKARALCQGLAPRSVDLVCFPEMIFTGYMFPDAHAIAPFLEHPHTGPTASFCKALAKRVGCTVIAGLPERLPVPALPLRAGVDDPSPDYAGANAALVWDASGHLVHTYHKSNLFPTDVTWARAGGGFRALDLPLPPAHHPVPTATQTQTRTRIRATVAICNDVNVATHAEGGWRSIEEGPYELAGFCVRENVRVVVLLNAWLRPEDGGMEGVGVGGRGRDDNSDPTHAGEDEDEAGGDGDGLEPNWNVLNYWAMRLRPLWATDTQVASQPGADEQDTIVIVCNRFGRERGRVFAGSSAVFAMRQRTGKPRLLHVMGAREEGVSVWNVRLPAT